MKGRNGHFCFLFVHGERVHSRLAGPSSSMAFAVARRKRGEGNGCVPSRQGRWRGHSSFS